MLCTLRVRHPARPEAEVEEAEEVQHVWRVEKRLEHRLEDPQEPLTAVQIRYVFLQRPGGQAQFSVWFEAGAPTTRGLRQVLDAVVLDPAADHSTAAMAARAAVSERHLTRMFRDEVAITPARYVKQTRLEAAKVLLLTGDESQESVARRAGFGSTETMRRSFRRNLGVSPGGYRSRFRTTGIDRKEPEPDQDD
jgi:transcriptional regulator GlxA family with amidase domain